MTCNYPGSDSCSLLVISGSLGVCRSLQPDLSLVAVYSWIIRSQVLMSPVSLQSVKVRGQSAQVGVCMEGKSGEFHAAQLFVLHLPLSLHLRF